MRSLARRAARGRRDGPRPIIRQLPRPPARAQQGSVRMFWVIRWTDAQTDRDRAIVVEADSRAEAEYMGLKRGIPIVLLAHATRSDIAAARRARLLWRFSPAA